MHSAGNALQKVGVLLARIVRLQHVQPGQVDKEHAHILCVNLS